MTRRTVLMAIFLAAFTVTAWAQDSSQVFYGESFRQGMVRIDEDGFGVGLNTGIAGPIERVTDSHGKDRYELIIHAHCTQAGDEVIYWDLALKDLRHPKVGNILMSQQEPSTDPMQNLWKLELGRSSSVPTSVKRVIKVDGFYVTIEVRVVHFETDDSVYPDRADINLTFTNSDPRAGR